MGIFVLAVILGASYFLFKDKLESATASNTISAVPSPSSAIVPSPSAVPSSPSQTSAADPSKLDLISSANPELYKTLAQIPNVPQGTFNYGGSTTFAPLRSDNVVSSLNQAHPEFKLRYTESIGEKAGSGSGIKMLLDGQLSFSQSSRPVKDTEFAQANQGVVSNWSKFLLQLMALYFYVNPKLSIPGLTLSQIKDIFTGKITELARSWRSQP